MKRWLAVLLLLTATAGPGVAADRSTGPVVTEVRTYDRTPETAGSVRFSATYELASGVDGLCVRLPPDATAVEVTGFDTEYGNFCDYRWDGDTADPTVSFTVPVETTDDGAPGPFVETGDWALARATVRGRVRTGGGNWTRFRESDFEREYRFAGGNGAGVEHIGLMGPTRTANWTGDRERFRLVRPRAGSVAVERYRRVLSAASRDFRVGNRGNVTVVALTEGIHAGSASGNVMLVPAGERWPFEYTRQSLLHEYVHTRQSVYTEERMAWFTEGSASYYDLLLAHQQGELSYEAFREKAAGGKYPDAVLADRSTWQHGGIPYERGPRVLAALDARIRNVTNGTRTFADVFYLLNRRSGQVSYAEFERDVATVAGRSLDAWLDRYFTTNATPPMPDGGDWVTQPRGPRDFDGDGLPAAEEKSRDLNPFRPDSDGDGLPDGGEPGTPTTTESTTTGSTTHSAATATRDATTTETAGATPSSTTISAADESSGASTPGFGVVPALAALVFAAFRAGRS